MSSIQVYDAQDTSLDALANKRIAVIGYGIQGHAHALNLRDSGLDVVVGLRPSGPSAKRAREAGFEVLSVEDAVRGAALVSILIPDTAQPSVYHDQIEPVLEEGSTLLFAHGFNVHYEEIVPPTGVDVVLVAPKAPGQMVRREFLAEQGVPALVGVYQDATGHALDVALAYAHALGSTRAGVLETTFADETETDLFGEQAVLCGGVTELVTAGFDTLVEAGYAPELAYFECLHELKLIVDLFYAGGFSTMRRNVSDTAEYGDYVSGPRVIDDSTRARMREVLDEVRSGAFAREWIDEARAGEEELRRMRAKAAEHPIEEVGQRLRARMAWLEEDA